MFKRVVNHKGFWRSVLVLSVGYVIILLLVQWVGANFSADFIYHYSASTVLMLIGAAFFCGFMVSYGKFWGKLKSEDYKGK